MEGVRGGHQGSSHDGLEAMRLVCAAYEAAQKGEVVGVP